jgi:hypothetical protein
MSRIVTVINLMEAEILEFLLSHQYNNKTCCHNGVRFLSNLLIERQKYI